MSAFGDEFQNDIYNAVITYIGANQNMNHGELSAHILEAVLFAMLYIDTVSLSKEKKKP
jgi:hypothetical protein